MRLFIAVRFENDALDALEAARDAVFAHAESGAPVPRDNLHLTLLFLGNIEEDDVETLEDALDEVADPLRMELMVDHVELLEGRAPGSEGTKPGEGTWRAHIADASALARLQKHVEARMRKVGVELDNLPFEPHVTLGRRVVLREGASAEAVAAEALRAPLHIKMNSFSLMESRPSKKKGAPPRYEEICAWED